MRVTSGATQRSVLKLNPGDIAASLQMVTEHGFPSSEKNRLPNRLGAISNGDSRSYFDRPPSCGVVALFYLRKKREIRMRLLPCVAMDMWSIVAGYT